MGCLVEPCEQTIMKEAGFVASLVRNAVKSPLMLADIYPSDGARLKYNLQKFLNTFSCARLYLVTHFPE